MPLYEYQCKKCGHRFEKIQKFSDKMVKKCRDCGGVVEQMISAPAVQFKGSGWYKTDSRPADKSESKSETKSETKSESKSETKPDAKSGAKAKPKDQSSPKSEGSS